VTIEERLDLLEAEAERARAHRRWYLTATALSLLIAVVALMWGMTRTRNSRAIRTQRLILEDQWHRQRGTFSANWNSVSLILGDESGMPRAALAVDSTGPALWLWDENGANRRPRIGLAVVRQGPTVILRDAEDRVRASLDVLNDRPTLSLTDDNGNTCVCMGAFSSGPAISMWNADSRMIWAAP